MLNYSSFFAVDSGRILFYATNSPALCVVDLNRQDDVLEPASYESFASDKIVTVPRSLEEFDQLLKCNEEDNVNTLDMDKKIVCNDCGLRYKHQSSLYTHKKYYCGKTPDYQCPECDFKSFQQYNIRMHMQRKHTSTKSTKCTTSQRRKRN